jgi:hypothetical protein
MILRIDEPEPRKRQAERTKHVQGDYRNLPLTAPETEGWGAAVIPRLAQN